MSWIPISRGNTFCLKDSTTHAYAKCAACVSEGDIHIYNDIPTHRAFQESVFKTDTSPYTKQFSSDMTFCVISLLRKKFFKKAQVQLIRTIDDNKILVLPSKDKQIKYKDSSTK